jgi:hypothetical protein
VILVAFYTQVTLPVLITFIFMLYRLQPQVQKLNSIIFSCRHIAMSL